MERNTLYWLCGTIHFDGCKESHISNSTLMLSRTHLSIENLKELSFYRQHYVANNDEMPSLTMALYSHTFSDRDREENDYTLPLRSYYHRKLCLDF
jgi:hypothetical protein